MIMANSKEFIDKCRMYRDWGRIGNNSEDMIERFGASVDGIPYDGKFLYGVVGALRARVQLARPHCAACECSLARLAAATSRADAAPPSDAASLVVPASLAVSASSSSSAGYNMKSCEMNAAFGNVQLTKLPRFRKIRRDNFERFLANMQGTTYGLPAEPYGFTCDWLAFPLLSTHRAELLEYLESNNIQTRVTFAGNITRHPAYRAHYFDSCKGGSSFPNADRIMAQGLLLGCHHGTNFEQIDRACELLKAFEAKTGEQSEKISPKSPRSAKRAKR